MVNPWRIEFTKKSIHQKEAMNAMNETSSNEVIERIFHEWDDALSKLDVERLLALYAPDATLESPLVPHLLKTERGVCRGHGELRKLLEELART